MKPVKPLDPSRFYRRGQEPRRPRSEADTERETRERLRPAYEALAVFGMAQRTGRPQDAAVALWSTLHRLEGAWLTVADEPLAAELGMHLLAEAREGIAWLTDEGAPVAMVTAQYDRLLLASAFATGNS